MDVQVDHPHADPGDGRSECETCGKWVWEVTHSCKGIPVTQAARERYEGRQTIAELAERQARPNGLDGVL